MRSANFRTHWEAEHVARQRVFTHYLSPGHRPAVPRAVMDREGDASARAV